MEGLVEHEAAAVRRIRDRLSGGQIMDRAARRDVGELLDIVDRLLGVGRGRGAPGPVSERVRERPVEDESEILPGGSEV